jgi:hypothetical protein
VDLADSSRFPRRLGDAAATFSRWLENVSRPLRLPAPSRCAAFLLVIVV